MLDSMIVYCVKYQFTFIRVNRKNASNYFTYCIFYNLEFQCIIYIYNIYINIYSLLIFEMEMVQTVPCFSVLLPQQYRPKFLLRISRNLGANTTQSIKLTALLQTSRSEARNICVHWSIERTATTHPHLSPCSLGLSIRCSHQIFCKHRVC